MLTALALAGAADPALYAATNTAHYVADQIPAQAITLDIKKICAKNGYVDPGKLAVQLLVQLDMLDELSAMGGQTALLRFDGRDCPAGPPPPGGPKQSGWCTGSIVIQRLLLNVYPGYLPRKDEALAYKVDEADLRKDVVHVSSEGRANITQFAKAFVKSTSAQAFVECDFAAKPRPADRPAIKVERMDSDGDPAVMERNSLSADVAEGSVRTAAFLKLFQFRQHASNLVYRRAADSIDGADPTYASGLDLYKTDAGLSFSRNHKIGDEAGDGYERTIEWGVVGVVGVPLCGLIRFDGKPCESGRYVDKTPSEVERTGSKGERPTYTWDVVPYVAADRSFSKTKDLRTADPEKKSPTTKQWEYGAVAYLSTDEGPESCFWNGLALSLRRQLANCASNYAIRVFRLENELDKSELNGIALRYTPLIKTATPGFRAFDFCLNTLCGDPDQMVRMGLLGDIRFNHGAFEHRGTNALQRAFNENYDRLGGRVGAMALVKLLPETPINVWAAYTDFHAFRGFERDLGQVQVQANIQFSAMTVGLEWRNGRREDTAKRDTSVSLSVGFKTK